MEKIKLLDIASDIEKFAGEELPENLKSQLDELKNQLQKRGPGRKKGQKGFKCKKKRYLLNEISHEIGGERATFIGEFCTLKEIADHYGFSYQKIAHISKGRHSLSDTIKIVRL